ncbi:hypothetical protein ABZ570_11095 [Micromonospora sp. NPDC007271]|uniref:hypothetical protein n=1 Tax=Micromonospora sp. NPDC007271 TaxID=3154587 RepID=UPI0033F9993B
MVSWFRRRREDAPTPPDAPPEDDPAALGEQLRGLVRFINESSGRLPGESVVTARRITDVLREIIDSAEVRALDVYAVISVKATVGDYLPATLTRFLAIDPSQLNVPSAAGPTPVESLQVQLDSLLDSVVDLLAATRAHDADALAAHGRFLHTKFSRSDLEI